MQNFVIWHGSNLHIGIPTLNLCYFDVPHPLESRIGPVESKGLCFLNDIYFACRGNTCHVFSVTSVADAREVLPMSAYTIMGKIYMTLGAF